MEEVAIRLRFKNRNSLFKFLRRYNIIVGSYPAREFIIMDYFGTIDYPIKNKKGETFKKVPVIRVTQKGMKFIEKLHNLLTADLYVSAF